MSLLYEKAKSFVFIFLQMSQTMLTKFNMLMQPVGLLKLLLTCRFVEALAQTILQNQYSRERYMKHSCHTGLRSNALESMSFKHGLMIEMTELYSLVPV